MKTIPKNTTHLIVVGNGFDINLGLKTSYNDFLKSEQFASQLNDSNHLATYLKNSYDLNLWIDVEKQLAEYSLNVSPIKKTEFFKIKEALKKYLQQFNNCEINKSSEAYNLISSIKQPYTHVLNFNYTNTIERILQSLTLFTIDKNQFQTKVHGSIDENSDIVFGVDENTEISSDNIFIRKSYSKSFDGINLRPNIKNLKKITFFGHSLGSTDHFYFEELFEYLCKDHNPQDTVEFTIHYYGEESYDRIMGELERVTKRNVTKLRQNVILKTIDHNVSV